jgi:ERCC4-type nuclease
VILVSPAERGEVVTWLNRVATSAEVEWRSSGWPERVGLDYCWTDAHGGWQGCQRKEIRDLIASMRDDRLRRELGQMRSWVDVPVIVVEGRIGWTSDGEMTTGAWGQNLTRKQWNGLLLGLQGEGVHVVMCSNAEATARYVVDAFVWHQKPEHGSLRTVVKVSGDWGTATNREFQIGLLAGIPGLGMKRAKAIVEHFDGVPWQWAVTAKELMEVEGIGKGTAAKLLAVLTHKGATDE